MNQLQWDDLEPKLENIEEAASKAYELNIHFLRTFSTPSGKKVLEWLTSHTLDTPTWWPSADYQKAVANGFFREGQNSLVRQILHNIDNAKSYKESQK